MGCIVCSVIGSHCWWDLWISYIYCPRYIYNFKQEPKKILRKISRKSSEKIKRLLWVNFSFYRCWMRLMKSTSLCNGVCRLYGKQLDVNTLCYSSGPQLNTNASTVTCITPAISLTLVYLEVPHPKMTCVLALERRLTNKWRRYCLSSPRMHRVDVQAFIHK